MAEPMGRAARSPLSGLLAAAGRRFRHAGYRLPRRRVRMGRLRRTAPLSRQFGYDRGQPVDRHYVEQFLEAHAHQIRGRVLEIGDSEYTHRFGGGRVTRSDVLNIAAGHPETTIVADLADADHIPSDSFDALVVTQTLHLVYDLPRAVRTLHRILRPGATALVTVPGISPVSSDQWSETWYWSLTPLAARRLFGEVFGDDWVVVEAHGNVLTTVAFLEGMASHELRPEELELHDPQFPMLVTVTATRSLDNTVEARTRSWT
jgi:SAM-dependent methyltransferase